MRSTLLALALLGCLERPASFPDPKKVRAEALAQAWITQNVPGWFKQLESVSCTQYCQEGLTDSRFEVWVEDLRDTPPVRAHILLRCDSLYNYGGCNYVVVYPLP